ncbi:YfcL family protein [Vibrio ulleungensis]|jgi:hypothetical protein|uniref:YfcL family protein n=1 Tax=Vibrio ulleungensis TaxID=2807619 RepID=A0ABS2HGT6_9VIBR|nr:YfcL family protein [Vibrio ulleungensis]MBM7036264.1 YfcL family protein [Vibrio ulleungensis]
MILDFEEQLLNQIDQRVENASDDELFAGGYLRGHISLAVSECEEQGVDSVDELKNKVAASLNAARSELTPADRVIVDDLWNDLVEQL